MIGMGLGRFGRFQLVMNEVQIFLFRGRGVRCEEYVFGLGM